MNTPPYIPDANPENFKVLVLENSENDIVAIFNLPGNEHEVVANCRALLAEALQ